MKIGKLISSFIVGIILAFSLFGCTEKANSIKKAFEKEGYEWHQIEEINDVELIDNIYYVTNNKGTCNIFTKILFRNFFLKSI